MKKYKVNATERVYYSLIVAAKSMDEAKDKFYNMCSSADISHQEFEEIYIESIKEK